MGKKQIAIDWETADRITLDTLKQHRVFIEKDLRQFEKDSKKGELGKHRYEEAGENKHLLENFKQVMKYFGHKEEAPKKEKKSKKVRAEKNSVVDEDKED